MTPAGGRGSGTPTAAGLLAADSGSRSLLLAAYQAALAAVGGRQRVRQRLERETFAAGVSVIAAGKAACAMAEGAHDVLGARIREAFVVTRRGYAEALPWPVREAGHPRPDADSLAAGAALLAFVDRLPPDGEVLVLLSGGASALVEALPPGLGLADWQRANDWLLGSGLDIAAVNGVRKRLSRIKGGRLAQWLAPRRVLCLAISDVPGDDPGTIGSGPLSADRGGPPPARLPPWLADCLAAAAPPPPPDAACFARVRYEIVAGNRDALAAAVQAIERRGVAAIAEPEFIVGEAADAGLRLAQRLRSAPAAVAHVWGSETTVTLPAAAGRGGRCQQLALAAARELDGVPGAWLLAAGTDGSDGPTADAGALVDGGTVARGAPADAAAALRAADAGAFLEASGDLLQTGPTGTNVMDLIIGLRDG